MDLLWFVAALLMTTTGVIFFGWRGLLCACTIGLATLLTYTLLSPVMRLLGRGHRIDSNLYALTSGLMLGAVMSPMCHSVVPLVVGLGMGAVLHVVGRSHWLRIHPVAFMVVVVWLWGSYLSGGNDTRWAELFGAPGSVLQPQRIVRGDICDVAGGFNGQPWWTMDETVAGDAVSRREPYVLLVSEQRRFLENRSILPTLLSAGRLRPMGEIVFGTIPGGYGTTSCALMIFIGLCVIYYRLTWWPMAATALAAAIGSLVVMPLTYMGHTVLVGARLFDLGPSVAVTYLSYMLLSSPLALVAMILAPQTMPTNRRGRVIYGAIIGSGMIVIQWAWSTEMAAFVSLLIAGVISRPLDSLHRSPFIEKRLEDIAR